MRNAASAEWSRDDLIAMAILLLAAALSFATSGYSLWFDEIAAVAFAHQPLELLWSGWMARETNPPLYYTLLKVWIALFGDRDASVRALSVFIGMAGIGAGWWLARRTAGVRAGLTAAALLATSAAHVDFSQEVRGYILAQTGALFACVAVAAYLERPRPAPLLGYVVATVVALYSHTMMIVFVALTNLAMVWLLRGDRAALLRWIAANAGVALLWSWWAWISFGQVRAGGAAFSWIEKPDLISALNVTAVMYLPLYLASEKVAFAPALAFAALASAIWFAARDRRPVVVLLATMVAATPLLLLAMSQALPVLLPRTLFWATGPALVLLAVAIASVPSRMGRMTAVALVLALQIGGTLRWLAEREVEAWPQQIAAIARTDPQAVVMVQGDAMGVATRHYLAANGPGLRLVIVEQPAGGQDRWADGLIVAPHINAAAAQAMLAGQGSVFTLRRGDHDPGKLLVRAGVEQPLPEPLRGRQPWLSQWRARSWTR